MGKQWEVASKGGAISILMPDSCRSQNNTVKQLYSD